MPNNSVYRAIFDFPNIVRWCIYIVRDKW